MQISSNTWHYKVFDWWFKEVHHGWSFEYYHGQGKRYNLCPYVRAVLFWGPGLFIFTPPRLWGTLGLTCSILTWINFHYHGLLGLKSEGIVLGLLGVIIGLVTGLVYLGNYLQAQAAKRREANSGAPPPESSFVVILRKYFKSLHDDVCPSITFEDKNQTDTRRSDCPDY